jgi:hypothetical protein
MLLKRKRKSAPHITADWERAILIGFAAWRTLRENRGGVIEFDLNARTLRVR